MKNRRNQYLMLGAVFKVRGLLMLPPLAYAILHFDGRLEDSIAGWGVGLLLFFSGVYLRVAAQRHLRYRLKSRKQLATTGPFHIVRNPVYWANMSILAGLAFMAETPWMAPILVVWAFVVYELSIRFEEMRLLKRFGDEYSAYLKATPRWIPRFGRQPAEPSTRGTRWWPAIAVELHCMLLIALPIAKEILENKLGGWKF